MAPGSIVLCIALPEVHPENRPFITWMVEAKQYYVVRNTSTLRDECKDEMGLIFEEGIFGYIPAGYKDEGDEYYASAKYFREMLPPAKEKIVIAHQTEIEEYA